MQPLFSLGVVKIIEPANALMERAGQDAEFFLQMHVCGIWSDEYTVRNKQSLQTGSMIVNRYRTFLGDEITIVTFADRRQTGVFGESHEPNCHHCGYTYDPVSDYSYTPPDSDSTPATSGDDVSLSTSGVFGTLAFSPPIYQNEATAYAYERDLPQCNVPAFSPVDTDSLCSPPDEDEPELQDSDYTLTEESLTYQYDSSAYTLTPLFEPLGYVPNMTYDREVPAPSDTSSTAGSTDTPTHE